MRNPHNRQISIRAAAVATIAAAALALTACTAASAGVDGDGYPSGPITIVVGYAAGGSGDPIAREYAAHLKEILGTSVVVENLPGGSGTIGITKVVNAKPDGYTLGFATNSSLSLQVLSNPDLSFQTTDAYTTIGGLGSQPAVIGVRADAPWETFEDLIDDMKKNPGEITIAVGGAGNVKDLQLQEFARTAGVEFVTAPFSGGGAEAVTAVLGGRTDAIAVNGSTLAGLVESGDIRGIVAFTPGKFSMFPAETFADNPWGTRFVSDSFGMIAPAGLPENVQTRLEEAHAEIMADPEFIAFIEEEGAELFIGTGADFAAQLTEDKEVFQEMLND